MRVLLDTNILIYREDDHIITSNVQKLLRALNQTRTEILVHPLSLEELERDSDKNREKIMRSKAYTYPLLESPPDPQRDYNYSNAIEWDGEIQGRIDNTILYAVYKDAVDFLITEDKGIHKKARKLSIDNRVLLISDAIQIFEGETRQIGIVPPPALKSEFVYNLTLNDPFFEPLKKSYAEFENWFKKISREGRKCWVHFREDNSIGALLIYKIEDEAIDSIPSLPKTRRLKICTFTVTSVGQKLGELFIKLSIDYAIENNVYEIYLTHFTEPNDRLVELISEYGFYKAGVNRRGEDLYLKNLFIRKGVEILSPIEIARKFYPCFYDGDLVKKFIIPIQPKYHNRLFTDCRERQTTISEYIGSFIVEGNTIKKAYLCHSRSRKIKPGDIVLFYRSKSLQGITSLGVVESLFTKVQNVDTITRLVGKRTVYSREEIKELVKKPTIVILFRHHFHMKECLHLQYLIRKKVLLRAPQSISEISDRSYVKVRNEGGIDERFAIH